MTQTPMGNIIWATAEILRGDYKQADYGKIILPMTIARRLDGMAGRHEKDVEAVLKERGPTAAPALLEDAAQGPVYNISGFNFEKLLADPGNLAANLIRFTSGFPESIREIFQRYKFADKVQDLADKNLLLAVVKKFAAVDLEHVSNEEMGTTFEDLIRRFSELSNETAGEHYTPREVIDLMVQLLFTEDDNILATEGTVKKLYDPTAGTGGMLSTADDHVKGANPNAKLALFGQELNDESYAICKADMVIKGYDAKNVQQGNTLTDDKHAGMKFDYVLSNPPFGVDWGKAYDAVNKEHRMLGMSGRFGPGLPRKSDGTFLFMLHGLHKLDEGGRMAIVTNGSPLFTGNAGSGESEIRRYLLENDLIEAIIALPTDMFYNTGIQTYIWVLSKSKVEHRKGLVQLIDASGKDFFEKMPKSLGSKRNRMADDHIAHVVKAHGDMEHSAISKVVPVAEFGYRTIAIDRPMKHNYAASEERLSRLTDDRKIRKFPEEQRAALLTALREKVGAEVLKNRNTFQAQVQLALAPLGLKATEIKNVVDLLAERDETAEPVRDSKKRLLPDTDLRDTEDVPLTEAVQAYFEREVLTQTPDAWINDEVWDDQDRGLGRVGYEIPFNRYFYTYEAPPSLKEVDDRIRARSGHIMDLLKAVVG
ncbi:type I restriction-modification system subunit M [Deinococcus aquaticus]|uniref:type I restriction-modification system subunit M n=1 Tax=Deinococcus aquaticus TaxID=328692 RepID=UPI003F4866B8